jgi:hypothetical protein
MHYGNKDPRNIKTCSLCQGSGKRPDMEVANGCNGCGGTGKATKWPTEYAEHPGDIAPIESVTDEAYANFFRITLQGRAYQCERYEPWHENNSDRFVKQELPPLEWVKKNYGGYLAVVVDNHS